MKTNKVINKNSSNKNSNIAYVSNLCFFISEMLCLAGIRKSNISIKPFYLVKGFPKYLINISAILQTTHVGLMYLYFLKTNFSSSTKEDATKTSILLKFVTFQYMFGYGIFWMYKLLSIYHRDIVLMLNNIEVLKENACKGKKDF